MKKAILSSLLLAMSIAVFAQDTEEEVPATRVLPDIKKHELGIMTQMSGTDDNVDIVGAQYKLWKGDKALRFMAGFGNYHYFNSSILALGTDSVTEVHSHIKVNMAMIGGGLEMQRHFWKKVYLFAGVELRGGYGTGTVDTTIARRQRTSQNMPGSTLGTPFIPQDVQMTYIAATPSIGAKIQGKRLSVGLELMPVQLSYRHLNYDKGTSYGIADFHAAIFQQRVFINYRF